MFQNIYPSLFLQSQAPNLLQLKKNKPKNKFLENICFEKMFNKVFKNFIILHLILFSKKKNKVLYYYSTVLLCFSRKISMMNIFFRWTCEFHKLNTSMKPILKQLTLKQQKSHIPQLDLQTCTSTNTRAADMQTVDYGIPYFPFQVILSRMTKNIRPPMCYIPILLFPALFYLHSLVWNSRIQYPEQSNSPSKYCARHKNWWIIKCEPPSFSSLSSVLELCSFFVTSNIVSDNLKILNMALRNPHNHAVMAIILAILWLFHHDLCECILIHNTC